MALNEDKVRRYRDLAAHTLGEAQTASRPEIAEALQTIAFWWRQLAAKVAERER